MYAAKNSILGERKFRLMNQRDMEKLNEDYHTEKYLRHQQIHETLDLLALFEKPDTAKLVREVALSVFLVLLVVLSVARLAGTVARKTRRTRTSNYVVGFMQQRPSRLRNTCQQRGKGMADDMLFIEHSHQMEKGVSAFFIIRIRASCSFLQVSSSPIFLTKNHKYRRLSLRSCDSLQLFLYLCGQNLAYHKKDKYEYQ